MYSRKRKGNTRHYSWEMLPPEIMYKIFSYLDEKCLLNCMAVNKRWYCLVSTIARASNWKNMVIHGFPDMGTSFIKKSLLNWREMAVNACLWRTVKNAEPVVTHNYKLENIRKVNVYRGYIIVTCPPKVIYYDIETFKPKKSFDYPCSNFDENDYLFAATSLDTFELTLCYKPNPNSPWRADYTDTFNVDIYKMIYAGCFAVSPDNSLYFMSWINKSWNKRFVARFFSHGRISDVLVYRHRVYALMDWGKILIVDKDELKFILGFTFSIPRCRVIMYQNTGAIIQGSPTRSMKFLRQGQNHWILKVPHLTCVLVHGDVLFLGYKNGEVQIYLPHNMKKSGIPNAELSLNVQDYVDRPLIEPTIIALDVSEGNGSQELFVATRTNLLQFTLKYPQGMRDFMLETDD